MKIIALVTAYNEDTFLNEVLSATYDYFDEFIVTDTAIQCMVDAGYSSHSTDRTVEIVNRWKCKGDKVHLIQPKIKPKNYTELSIPGFEMAKKHKGDWIVHLGADEFWPENCLKPMRNFLSNCEKAGVYGVNIHEYYFAPDFHHWKPFYVPRIAKLTEDACLPFNTGDPVAWPSKGIWQSIELDKVPERVRKANIDYPSYLKPYHYSCVGRKRIEQKQKFYSIYEGNKGSEPFAHYMNKNWEYFKQAGYKEFKGQHPKIMKNHPLYNERMY